VLVCEECGRVAGVETHGWRAFYAEDPDNPEPSLITVVYCPECAEREFGPPPRRANDADSDDD
jgi:hypothetical protein